MGAFVRANHNDLVRRAAAAGNAAEDVVQDLYERMLLGRFDGYPKADWRPATWRR